MAVSLVLALLLPVTGIARQPGTSPLMDDLGNGRPVVGTFAREPRADLDFIVIDAQYGEFDITGIGATIKSIKQDDRWADVAVIVRIPLAARDDPRREVSQLLGAGVDGLMFPDVETRAQAQVAIDSMRAGGGRLWPVDPAGNLIAMIQIESPVAMQNLEDILGVTGIGALFLGPTDMAVATGAAGPDAPSVEAMVQEILQACIAGNIPCGYPIVAPDRESATREVARRVGEGFSILAVMVSP